MATNLGSWLGLIGASVIVWGSSRYIKNRIKKEGKYYGEETIKGAGSYLTTDTDNRTDAGADELFSDGELKSSNEELDEERGRVQGESIASTESDSVDEGRTNGDSKATEWDRVTIENIESIY